MKQPSQKPRSNTQAKKSRKELDSSLHQLKLAMEGQVRRLDAMLAGLAQGNSTIWNNQKELSNSAELLDEQFAVSTRLAVANLNKLFEATGHPELKIGEKQIEDTFKDWAQFKKRVDFRDLMLEWTLGTPLSELPPEPQPEAKEEPPPQEA